jgi:hypothetical protein
VLVLACLAAGTWLSAAEPNFVAVWSDDSRSEADEVREWHRLDSHPTLGGRQLFDPKNPIRWLRDTRITETAPAAARVEFVGGDCLPCRVVGYLESSTGDGSLPRLLVEPSIEIDLPRQHRNQIGVRLDFVRRIVWQSHGAPTEPGTLVLADGRVVSFRSIRWTASGVQVLTDGQPAQFEFADMAELHLPPADAWTAHLRALALLTRDQFARLMRIEADRGTRMTTSLARFQARSVGGDEPQKWFHLVQPAWSLEALAIPHRLIRQRTFVSPQEVPLSWLSPVASRHRGAFSAGWGGVQIDRNVQGGLLRSGGLSFGWGLGTHAHHELDFDLPASARKFRTHVGLDQMVTVGGCARGRVLVDGKAIFASPLLIGSDRTADSAVLSVGSTTPRRLTLVSDAAEQDRPSGADPFDVRDVVDWLEPTVGCDQIELWREIESAAPRALWGPSGWTVDQLVRGGWHVVNEFSDGDHAHPCFRPLLALDAPLTLTRRLQVEPGRTSARLVLGRPRRSANRTMFEIAINGRRLPREEVPPLGESGEPKPIEVSLAGYDGGEIEFTIRFDPAGKSALVDWRGVVILDDTAASDTAKP